jgi:homoserine O-acetyltransferase
MTAALLTTGTATIGDLTLRSGVVLPDVKIAYATAGMLSTARDNVILVTHGFTSSHLFIGRVNDTAAEGSWSDLVGPGRALDTDRFFVISSNMLGSSYGSTAPASLNPATGKPYGPDFPKITVADIVAAQRKMLADFGIGTLVAVVGPSYGGFQGLTWAIEYPGAMRGVSASVTGLRAPGDVNGDELRATFSEDPNWNGGWHYDRGGIAGTMAAMRLRTLHLYGVNEAMRDRIVDDAAREATIRRQAESWGRAFDPNGMIALAEAAQRYDVSTGLARIKARVQFVLCRTDKLFPPSLARETMKAFADAGLRAEYVEIDSEHGHHASGSAAQKWAADLKRFIAEVAAGT